MALQQAVAVSGPNLSPAVQHPLPMLSKLPFAPHDSTGREVREQMFEQVTDLLHDLDEGMLPVSVINPYLPLPAHRKRDR